MAQQVKNLPAAQETQELPVLRCLGKIPWRRAWQPTPVFLPGESHGQRNLTDYSPWGHQESDMAEAIKHNTQNLFDLNLSDLVH